MKILSHEDILQQLDHPFFRLISDTAEELALECYVIGGWVRDLYLERPSSDIDIVVVDPTQQTKRPGIAIAEALRHKLGKKAHIAIYKNFGTAQLKHKSLEIEFVGARKESYDRNSRKPVTEDGTLEEDQNRRDFTINAMALCLNKERFGELVDPFDGLADLEYKTIATPLDPDITFSDDPLRMMRCIRFATQLSFTIVPESFEAIKRNKERLDILSLERINEELNKILLSPKPSVGFLLLEESGLLEKILPQLCNLRGVETMDGKGHKDNFAHTLQVVDNIASTTDNLWLRWAALLHDIGKPLTKHYDQEIGWSFHNHDFVGGKMIPGIFRQLKMPLNEKMKYVQKLVQLHLRPIALVQDEVTDSAVRRLLFDAGDDINDLMLLCEADITSKNENKVKRIKSNFQLVRKKLVEVEEKDRVRNFKNPITGELIMQRYGLSPCSTIGIIKEYVKEAILDGIIENNYEQAFQLMEKKALELGLTPQPLQKSL